jgi:hypothetical protein
MECGVYCYAELCRLDNRVSPFTAERSPDLVDAITPHNHDTLPDPSAGRAQRRAVWRGQRETAAAPSAGDVAENSIESSMCAGLLASGFDGAPGENGSLPSSCGAARWTIAVAVTVGKPFNLIVIIPSNRFAATPYAGANAAQIIIGRRSLPIRCISRSAWRARGNGAGRTRPTGRNIARTTQCRWNETVKNSACGTKNGGWRILQTTTWLSAKR